MGRPMEMGVDLRTIKRYPSIVRGVTYARSEGRPIGIPKTLRLPPQGTYERSLRGEDPEKDLPDLDVTLPRVPLPTVQYLCLISE